jgi:hypothetical protein
MKATMHSRGDADARQAVRLLAMLSTMHLPEAYLNNNCFPRAP